MTDTKRAAQLMAFTAEGVHAGDFNARTRTDWKRADREARERAGRNGTVFLYPTTINALTGKVVGHAPYPIKRRMASGAEG